MTPFVTTLYPSNEPNDAVSYIFLFFALFAGFCEGKIFVFPIPRLDLLLNLVTPPFTFLFTGICFTENQLTIIRTVFGYNITPIQEWRDVTMRCDGIGNNSYWLDFKDNFYQMGRIGEPTPLLQWQDNLQFDIRYIGGFTMFFNTMPTNVYFDSPCID